MFIYVIVNSETLKIYVGQHKGEDLGKYLSRKFWDANHHTSGTRSHLYASMRKYSRDAWSIHPLISGIDNKKELDEWERMLIYALKVQHLDVGYNICDGGEGFTGTHTEEWKHRNSLLHQGRTRPPETGAKISKAFRNTPAQQAARDQTGRRRSPESIAKGLLHGSGAQTGHTHADGTKIKIGDALRGGHHSEDSRAHMSAAHKGTSWSAMRRAASSNPAGTGRMTAAERQARYRLKSRLSVP